MSTCQSCLKYEYMEPSTVKDVCLFIYLFIDKSFAQAVLELTVYLRLASNSEFSFLRLPSARILGMCFQTCREVVLSLPHADCGMSINVHRQM